ncbi:DUF4158 domain-containing protein [Streptosporangium lutulentum]
MRASLEQHGLLPGTIKSLLTNATRGFTTLYEQVWDSTGPEPDLPALSEDDLTALDEEIGDPSAMPLRTGVPLLARVTNTDTAHNCQTSSDSGHVGCSACRWYIRGTFIPKKARWDPQKQIREDYGYTAFEAEQWFSLAFWVYRRAWTTNERPIVLFDLATHRLDQAKILLPGVATLERMIASLRERAALRQYKILAAVPNPHQQAGLEDLVVVEDGRRVSSRCAATRCSCPVCTSGATRPRPAGRGSLGEGTPEHLP